MITARIRKTSKGSSDDEADFFRGMAQTQRSGGSVNPLILSFNPGYQIFGEKKKNSTISLSEMTLSY